MSSYLRPSADANNHDLDNDGSIVELTIRFSASIPDLPLSIPFSTTAQPTIATLKQRIRASLPPDYQNRRIRLIYAGKALNDDARLTTSLKIPSRAPSRVSTPAPGAASPYRRSTDGARPSQNDAGKGKTPVRDPPAPPSSQQRIYVHCSIGDVVLTPSELAAEAALATLRSMQASRKTANNGADTPSTFASSTNVHLETDGNDDPEEERDDSTTTPAPRGFDRLLNAGFSASEVQSLRLQFMAIQSQTHTPDTMPSPNTLRDMEDRWLDNGNSAGGAGGDAVGGMAMTDEDAQVGTLDDMIWGATMGFFWPVGCLMWGTREDGIWSARRKMAVVVGVVLNIGLGFVRYTA